LLSQSTEAGINDLNETHIDEASAETTESHTIINSSSLNLNNKRFCFKFSTSQLAGKKNQLK